MQQKNPEVTRVVDKHHKQNPTNNENVYIVNNWCINKLANSYLEILRGGDFYPQKI
jgi:hypothetical protein